MNPAFIFFLISMLGVCGFAILRGGNDERLGAVALAAAAILSPLALISGWSRPETGIILIDVGLFVALLLLALRSTAFWPLWATGFQLCAVAVHLVALISPALLPAAYAETLALWAYPVLLSLGIGTWFRSEAHHHEHR